MTKSMTGFAQETLHFEHGEIIIELKSLNSRYLDLHFNLADDSKKFEPQIRQKIAAVIKRGKVTCKIIFDKKQEKQIIEINYSQLESLVADTQKLAEKYKTEPIQIANLLTLPNILVEKKENIIIDEQAFFSLLEKTILSLDQQREKEGEHLQQSIESKLNDINEIIKDIDIHFLKMQHTFKAKLHDKLLTLSEQFDINADQYRFEQELIYFFNKMDIEEETSRLRSHIKQIELIIKSSGVKGRKLDFLLQEMNREANTIGSKAQAYDLSIDVVHLKVLFEQIREQIQNIE